MEEVGVEQASDTEVETSSDEDVAGDE